MFLSYPPQIITTGLSGVESRRAETAAAVLVGDESMELL
jgi:hypothetical protein